MPGILRFGACKSCVACQASSLSRSVWIGRWFMHSRPIPKPLFHLQTQQTIYPCHCRPVKSVLFWPSISVWALRTNNLRTRHPQLEIARTCATHFSNILYYPVPHGVCSTWKEYRWSYIYYRKILQSCKARNMFKLEIYIKASKWYSKISINPNWICPESPLQWESDGQPISFNINSFVYPITCDWWPISGRACTWPLIKI